MPSYSMQPDNGRVNRVSRLIVNPDTGPIDCCWSDCWNLARSTWTIRFHEHPPSIRCESPFAQHSNMTFCSQQHADYFAWSTGWRAHETAARNQGRILGMAPEGSKLGRLR